MNRNANDSGRSRTAKRLLILLPVLLIALLLPITGCASSQTKKPQEHKLPEGVDLSKSSWTEAFDKMHAKISREYAFTDWKDIDWRDKKDTFRPRIVAAQEAKDEKAYYLALREYLFSIPDGHVGLQGEETGYGPDALGLMKEQVGGGFGLTVAILDDNRLIVDWVSPQGPAAAAGIKPSAQIIRWGGLEASDALKAASTIWATVPSATDENKEFEQAKFLTRAPLGQTREVAFANPGEDEQQVSLTAYDDGMESLERQQQYSQMFFGKYPERMVESRALEAGVGYIKIYGEGDLSDKHPGDHTPTLEQFRTAIDTFVKSNASGLIIDVRSNAGGEDEMSADFLASFYDRKVLYEYQKWYNAETGKAAIVLPYEDGRMQPNTGLFIEPRPPIFKGPVTILVNNGCISSGEGIALGIKNLPNGSVVGFRGTNGSFGMVMGALINMPGGYTISYPVGQSLGKNKVVQIDSRNGEGGVAPDIRVPRDLDTVTRAAAGEDVELEYAIKSILEAQND